MTDGSERDEPMLENPAQKDNLISAMEAAGYTFDAIESTEDNLRFFGEGGNVLTMGGWEETEEWLNGIVLDDPQISDYVELQLHPERFAENEPEPGKQDEPEPDHSNDDLQKIREAENANILFSQNERILLAGRDADEKESVLEKLKQHAEQTQHSGQDRPHRQYTYSRETEERSRE